MSKEIQEIKNDAFICNTQKEIGLTQDWSDKLAKYAIEAKKFVDSVEEPGMKFFSTKNAMLKWDDEVIKNNTLICIILTHCYENTLYTGEFDADDKAPPKCFSLGLNGEELKPHDNCEEPQHETCKGCPNQEWKSGKGRAKACANKYRLALLNAGLYIPDENPELITDPQQYKKTKLGYLRVPPTSMINYTKFIKKLQAKGLPPFAMFSKIQVSIDKKTILKINFEGVKPIQDNEILDVLELRVKEAAQEIITPYEKIEDEEKDKKLKY